MSFLFGSAPHVETTAPTSTVSPQQQALLSMLTGLLGNGNNPAGVQAYTGQFAPPLSGTEQGALGAINSQALPAASAGPPANQTDTASNALNALNSAFNFQAPQVAAPQVGAGPQVTAPQISGLPQITAPQITAPQVNSAQAFQTGVAQPLIDDFTSRTIPAIKLAAARSAGGAYSSDTSGVVGRATQDLNRTLAQQGALYDYDAQKLNAGSTLQADTTNVGSSLSAQGSNLSAALAAAGANQQAGLTAQTTNQGDATSRALANLSALLSTNQTNVGSQLTAQGDRLAAVGQTGPAIGAAQAPGNNTLAQLLQILSAGGVERQAAQSQDTGAYNDFLNQITQRNALLQLMASAGVSPTQQSNSVAVGGSTGLLPGIATGLAGSAGVGNAVGAGLTSLLSMLSDRRAKEDIKSIGRLHNDLPVYTYRYKGEAPEVVRVGVMAQEVEKTLPSAVHRDASGMRRVDYAQVLQDAFGKAA